MIVTIVFTESGSPPMASEGCVAWAVAMLPLGRAWHAQVAARLHDQDQALAIRLGPFDEVCDGGGVASVDVLDRIGVVHSPTEIDDGILSPQGKGNRGRKK